MLLGLLEGKSILQRCRFKSLFKIHARKVGYRNTLKAQSHNVTWIKILKCYKHAEGKLMKMIKQEAFNSLPKAEDSETPNSMALWDLRNTGNMIFISSVNHITYWKWVKKYK